MLRMSDIWRRMMGLERMLRDLWVAPPGGYLRHLGPSPLTAVQRGATFFRHPFLICSSRLWTTTSVRHQNLLCQQRWDTFKRFNKNLVNIFQWILCKECAIGAKWFEGSLQCGHWATLVTQLVCCCFYILWCVHPAGVHWHRGLIACRVSAEACPLPLIHHQTAVTGRTRSFGGDDHDSAVEI